MEMVGEGRQRSRTSTMIGVNELGLVNLVKEMMELMENLSQLEHSEENIEIISKFFCSFKVFSREMISFKINPFPFEKLKESEQGGGGEEEEGRGEENESFLKREFEKKLKDFSIFCANLNLKKEMFKYSEFNKTMEEMEKVKEGIEKFEEEKEKEISSIEEQKRKLVEKNNLFEISDTFQRIKQIEKEEDLLLLKLSLLKDEKKKLENKLSSQYQSSKNASLLYPFFNQLDEIFKYSNFSHSSKQFLSRFLQNVYLPFSLSSTLSSTLSSSLSSDISSPSSSSSPLSHHIFQSLNDSQSKIF